MIQGGNMLYWAASCSAEISNCAFSLFLSQTQAEARCRAWREVYICTSKCECPGQRMVAKSQSEYKLGFNSEGVKLKGERLESSCCTLRTDAGPSCCLIVCCGFSLGAEQIIFGWQGVKMSIISPSCSESWPTAPQCVDILESPVWVVFHHFPPAHCRQGR